jgi:hypothetical protein
MADRNDVNIKVGISGAKKALDELTKVLDSYSKKEKAAQQIAHQAEVNQLKLKEANAERLHRARTLKEAERIKQVLNNAKIESDAMTRNIQKIEQTARLQSALSDQASKAHKANNAKIQSDLIIQHATQRAILETSTRIAEAASREEVAAARIVKNKNDALRTEERAGAATNSRIASEVRLESTKEKSASQSEQNALREQNLAERLNNSRLIGINKIATEERRALQFNAQEERRVRAEALRERLAASREASAAERMDMARTRFAQSQSDREVRIARQQGGFFGGLFGPQLGGAIETLGKLNLAFMVLGGAIRPVVDAVVKGTQAFADYQQTMMTLQVVTKNTGIQFSGAKRLIDEFNDGLSDEKAIAGAIRNFSSMGISLNKQEELIKAMRNGIIAMGGDMNTQLPLMALAIKRNSSELLDNMGVTKNVDEMYKEFAKTIGKTVKELTQQEKDTAVVNGVLKELSQYTGIAEKSMSGLSGQIALAAVNSENLWRIFGNFTSPVAGAVLDYFNYWAAAIRSAADNSKDLSNQLRYMPKSVSQQPGEGESRQQLGDRLRAVNQELAKNTQAGIRSDASIMDALRKRGDEIINQIHTIERAEKLARQRKEKADIEASERAAKQREKDAKQAEKDAKRHAEKKPAIQGPDLSGLLRKRSAEQLAKEEEARKQKEFSDFVKYSMEASKIAEQEEDRKKQKEDDFQEWRKKKANEATQNTADFLRSSFDVAYKLMQGDFATVAMNIGGMLGDSIIKNLSEMSVVQNAIKPFTEALVSGMASAATAISGIITSMSAFLMANPVVLLLAGLAAGIGAIMMAASKTAEEATKKIAERAKSIQDLLPKAEAATLRQQRIQKKAELEADLPGLRDKLAKEAAKRGTRQFNKSEYDKALYAVQLAETGVIYLADALANDLNDPLSDAAIKAKNAGVAIEKMNNEIKRSNDAFKSLREMNFDLQEKIFNQNIDAQVAAGKITKEEGDKQKAQRALFNESGELYGQAYTLAKGFMPEGAGALDQAEYNEAFTKFKSGDTTGMNKLFESLGIDSAEGAQLINVWKNIETYLTGKGKEINMPGSSPDKPIYTQVVNVRDFREAFPDSAYFRTGGPMINSSTSLPVNSNTATSRTGDRRGPTSSYA